MTLMLALLLSAAPSVDTAALREQARTLTLAGRWTDALKALDSAKMKVPPGETATLAFIATERGRVLADSNFFHKDDPAPALAALQEGERLARTAGDELVLSEARMQLARIDYSAAFETKDWKKPRAAFESVLAVREKLGDPKGISETLFYLGLTYEQDGQPDAAFERYTKSLAIAEKERDIILQSYVRRHMGGIQEERGELDAARQNIDLEVELRRKGGFLVGVPFALRHKADFVAAHGPGKAGREVRQHAGALPRANGPLAPRPREWRCEEGPHLRRAGRRDGETVRRALRRRGSGETPRRRAARLPGRTFVSLGLGLVQGSSSFSEAASL